MPSNFQPEKPNSPSQEGRSIITLLITAFVSALLVVMLFALVAPRLFGEGSVSWTVTLVAGGVVFLAVLLYRMVRRPS